MNILVLGANGYLGSKIAYRLLERGHVLICTKRRDSNMNRVNEMVNMYGYARIRFIPASIEAIETELQHTTFDWVLNFVCHYGRSDVLYDDVIEANIEFPLKVLNLMVESGTKKFLTIGTGLPNDFNMYSFTKKMFGEFGRFYVDKHNIDFYNMRLEMFYGSDEPRERFIPSLIHNMIDGKEINVTVGSQHRDIISIYDIVKVILASMDSNLAGYQEIQVGTGIAPTISELVDFVFGETGRKSVINKGSVPLRKEEPDCIADTTLVKEICDFTPVFWKDGIRQMITEIKMRVANEDID